MSATIEPLQLRKAVLSENDNPAICINQKHQLIADPSVCHYHFDEVHSESLAGPVNSRCKKT